MKKILFLALMCLSANVLMLAKDVKVSSPNGSLTVTLGVDDGKAWYQVNRGRELIIGRSQLGLVLKDGELRNNFKMGKTVRASLDETWSQPWGEDATKDAGGILLCKYFHRRGIYYQLRHTPQCSRS